jgi:hypothetical protein
VPSARVVLIVARKDSSRPSATTSSRFGIVRLPFWR